MQNQAVELNSVIYNAANQSFEALATLYAGTSSRSFACANNAPIDIILKDDAQDARGPAKSSMHLTCCASWPRNQFAIATRDDRFLP